MSSTRRIRTRWLRLRRRGRGSAGRLRRDRPGGARQVEGDGRAAPRHAFHRGRAAGLAGEAVDLRQAEAGALPHLLGGEEWLEDAADDLGRDAGAAVGYAQGDEFAGDAQRIAFVHGDVVGRDREAAAAAHGIARIDREVEQRQLELAVIDGDGPRAGRDAKCDRYITTQARLQDALYGRQPLTEIDHHLLMRLPARKGQKLAREGGAAANGNVDGLEGAEQACVGTHKAAQALGVAAHHHQEIVEVMRHAAGQLAEGLQPLRLLERSLGGLAALQLLLPVLGATQGIDRQADQRQHRRQHDGAAQQHGPSEIGGKSSSVYAGGDVKRIARHTPVASAALDAVERAKPP